MLTSHLGDPESKPLTVAQLRTLAIRMHAAQKPVEDRDLQSADLLTLGYDGKSAEKILKLLSRQEQLEYYVNQAARKGCYPITRLSPKYPGILRRRLGLDCPGCLWALGDSALLHKPMISLVGSRQLREENRAFAEEAGRQAALQGYVLVSGNARGADMTAQESCLESGGQVISIVADSLSERRERPGVLYISEDGFDMGFSAQRALSRNRIIHCLGKLTLVVQCTCGKGGTWNGTTQNLKKSYSPVFCYDDCSEAAKKLSELGAALLPAESLLDFSALQPETISFFD